MVLELVGGGDGGLGRGWWWKEGGMGVNQYAELSFSTKLELVDIVENRLAHTQCFYCCVLFSFRNIFT